MKDSALVLQTLRGNRRAFDELVRRYQDALYRHLLRQCGSREEAEDLCQETFIRLYRGLRHFQRGRPVGPYLFRIATNLWRDRLRARSVPTEPLEEARAAGVDLAEQATVRLEQQQIVEACLRLRPEYREAISLYYDQGFSYREIATALGVPVGTVSTRLARGLASLRQMLLEPEPTGRARALLALPALGWEEWLRGRLTGALQGQAEAPATVGPAVSSAVAGLSPAALGVASKLVLLWQGGTVAAKLGVVAIGLAGVALVGVPGARTVRTVAARVAADRAIARDPQLRRWEHALRRLDAQDPRELSQLGMEVFTAPSRDLRLIPVLIGVIDADNSYDTVYGVGYFGLWRLTGVKFHAMQDGAWWRRWWERNKAQYPLHVRSIPIPDFAKTMKGRRYVPYPESAFTFDGLAAHLRRQGKLSSAYPGVGDIAQMLVELDPARAVPVLIEVMERDPRETTRHDIGWIALGELTGVRYDPAHDGAWWQAWWQEHQQEFKPGR